MRLTSNKETGEIVMRGGIGDYDGGISADAFRDVLAEHAGEDVTILLNSEGGSVTDGLSIHNAIQSHDGSVTIHIDTIAASIATVVCCAANRVSMNSNAKFMIHRCFTAAMGNCKEFRSMADLMEMMDADIAASYSQKTGMDTSELISMMDAETWMDANSAFNSGFVDDIIDVHDKKPEVKAHAVESVLVGNKSVEAFARAVATRQRFQNW